jgi:hypothetical protein
MWRARSAARTRVTKAGQDRPLWTADPHRESVHDQYASGTATFEFTKNYKFTILNNENVWAKAMNRVVNEKVPVDKEVDELTHRRHVGDPSNHASGGSQRTVSAGDAAIPLARLRRTRYAACRHAAEQYSTSVRRPLTLGRSGMPQWIQNHLYRSKRLPACHHRFRQASEQNRWRWTRTRRRGIVLPQRAAQGMSGRGSRGILDL